MESEGGDEAQASSAPSTLPGGPVQTTAPAIVSLPQEEFDRLVGQRVAEAKRAATKGFLSDLGVTSADEAKALVKAQRDAEDASRTEVERAIARANDRAAEAEAQLASIAQSRHSLNVERALVAMGAQGDLEDLSLLVRVEQGAEMSAITAAAEALRAKYPALFGAGSTAPVSSEPTTGGAPARPSNSPDAQSRGEQRAQRYNPKERASFI